jgi:hypothetical protein
MVTFRMDGDLKKRMEQARREFRASPDTTIALSQGAFISLAVRKLLESQDRGDA